MSDRSILGAADVSDPDLAELLGADAIVGSHARPIDYDLEAMTTGGRFWVDGTARFGPDVRAFRLVVKVAQSVLRSPVMEQIPEEYRAMAAANLPWQVEPDVYRSELSGLMPEGLRLPACLAVRDLDEESAAVWLEAVRPLTGRPDRDHTAYALGRLAASSAVQGVADRIGHVSGPHQSRVYLEGRLQAQFVTAYRDGSVFDHPVVARHFGPDLRARLLTLVDAAPALVEEIEALPLLAAHGDACPNNLLQTAEGIVVIDWSYFCRTRVGFDLSQLLMSEIELGRASADGLADRQDRILDDYRAGLAAEGFAIDAATLRRAHAIQVAVAIGIAAVPLERLDDDPAVLEPLTRERARALDHLLSTLDL